MLIRQIKGCDWQTSISMEERLNVFLIINIWAFNASWSLSVAQIELYDKALKAHYKLRKDFFSYRPNKKVVFMSLTIRAL